MGARPSSEKPKTLALTNYQQEKVLFDTLHSCSTQSGLAACHAGLCQGSIMLPKATNGAYPSETAKEIEDFYNQYFSEQHDNRHLKDKRLREVMKELNQKNTITLTTEELEFATKTAWRNASRCIGRIQWKNLKLFDGRQVTCTKEMFNIICSHIEYAINGGNIRSAITVFPPKGSGSVCRIWNSQYISYAGFRNADGSIMGDPAHAEFTDICLKLGWKSQISRFEILPLVLQYGDEVNLYDIPKHLLLEVPITHPRCAKLAELKLKWYALPAVSGMNLKCAGQIFAGCAFSGWYMSTEIVRDLCDAQRYNLLKVIAESLDLDITKPAVFWKDVAAAELNIAVVHSFKINQVTLTDHHSASDSFIKHMENEQKVRGGCPADWVWITPPLGGMLTSVFHQEMLNYNLRPSFDYQDKPWLEGKWRAKIGISREIKLTFRVAARATLQCVRLFNFIRRQRKTCTILYATETGQSERFACQLKSMLLDLGLNTKVLAMNDYDINSLSTEQLLLVVASTFGNGDAPENGNEFEGRMEKIATTKLNKNNFVQRFGVFGLGSSTYPNFCAFAIRVDKLLESYGLQRLLPLGKGDDQGDQQHQFLSWATGVCEMLCKLHGISMGLEKSSKNDTHSEMMHYQLMPTNADFSLVKGLQHLHHKVILECKAISVESLVAAGSSQNTVLIKLHHEDVSFHPGDHAAVYPVNDSDSVQIICQHSAFDHDAIGPDTIVEVQPSDQGVSSRLPPTSLKMALTHYLNIQSTPKQEDLERILELCSCSGKDRETLLLLSKSSNEYNSWAELKPSWADLLTEIPSLRIPATFFLTRLPTMLPRYYSISNFRKLSPHEIHLTVSVLQYSINAQGKSKPVKGLCSNWLLNLQKDAPVHLHIRRNQSFYLPTDPSSEVVMIGAGSGIAPFRGFWQQKQFERDGVEKDRGNLYLFQGMRAESSRLYNDEVMRANSIGVIKTVVTAFSRDENYKRCYVQDKLNDHKDMLHDLILNKNAHVYICGDVKMADCVRKCLHELLLKSGESKSTDDIIKALKKEGRYHEDVYSILLI